MFILLAGSTETARALVVDEFLTQHDDWKHLAMEDIQHMDEKELEEDVLGFQETFMTMVACECAKEARAEGSHIIITCPTSEMIAGIYQEIDEEITSVYLGPTSEADGFDHVINGGEKSMGDICSVLNEIIEAQPA